MTAPVKLSPQQTKIYDECREPQSLDSPVHDLREQSQLRESPSPRDQRTSLVNGLDDLLRWQTPAHLSRRECEGGQ
jgi:hypothetical protein